MEVLDSLPQLCDCGRLGYLVIDPYQEDVNGLRVPVVLCKQCYFDLCQEI